MPFGCQDGVFSSMARSLFTKDECYLLAQVLALLGSSNYLSILPYRAKNISSRKEEFHEKFKHHYPYKVKGSLLL